MQPTEFHEARIITSITIGGSDKLIMVSARTHNAGRSQDSDKERPYTMLASDISDVTDVMVHRRKPGFIRGMVVATAYPRCFHHKCIRIKICVG